MLFSGLKKTGVIFCVILLCSCSLFDDSKDLPIGKRISILDTQSQHMNTENKEISDLPQMVATKAWLQSGGTSNHVMGNISGNDSMKKAWESSFGKGSGRRNLLLAQPIISGDYVYTQDSEGTVSAFNIADGKQAWKNEILPDNKHIASNGLNGVGIAADENKIYALTGYGRIVVFDAKSGEQIWRKDLNALIRTSPNICSDKLIIQTLDNKLFVLNTVDGAEIFKYNTSSEDTVLAGGATPACSIDRNIIVAGFSNGQIEAFNASIGYPLWTASLVNNKRGNSTTNINAIKASPIIDNDIVYAIGNNDMFMALDYRTGETIWSKEIGSVNTPWVVGEYIYVVSNNNDVVCFNKFTGEIVFSVPLLKEYDLDERTEIYLMGPIMVNNKLLVSASNGMVYIISPINGQIEYKVDTKSKLPYSPISAQDMVIFASSDAKIIAFK